jgi:ankyrin repeat protein
VLKAALLGHCDIVQQLLDAGATLNAELQFNAVSQCCNTLEDAAAVRVVKVLLLHSGNSSLIATITLDVGC